ncbi:uncharacterized protein LOC115888291 [Sitophilus oryzae]|uniref:Uncharacterized protein LOC115888291 n=1 Tax=Sitophilus oryzae TaxID=7048 RepID=A0A6J2YLV3_SITOR|nr:uncharacterized protein LOC115888291 [Sitophilus oryzae]
MDKVRESYRVCDIHFAPESRYTGIRNNSNLKKDAIPTLFTTGTIQKDSRFVETKLVTREQVNSTPEVPSEVIPSHQDQDIQKPFTSQVTPQTTPKRKRSLVKLSSPAKLSGLKRRTRILAYTKIGRASQLTPEGRKLYKIAGDLRKTAKRLNFSREDLKKSRLKNEGNYRFSRIFKGKIK